jgi:hypothetical protein
LEARNFVCITVGACTKEGIFMMEVCMLTALGILLCRYTGTEFLARYRRVGRCAETHHPFLAQSVIELTLPDLMMRFGPMRLIQAAALLCRLL